MDFDEVPMLGTPGTLGGPPVSTPIPQHLIVARHPGGKSARWAVAIKVHFEDSTTPPRFISLRFPDLPDVEGVHAAFARATETDASWRWTYGAFSDPIDEFDVLDIEIICVTAPAGWAV